MKKILTMKLIKETFGVCRFENNDTIPTWAFEGEFFSITKTDDELSVVCGEKYIPMDVKCERDWRALKVLGPLDFSLVGILSKISTVLANESVSIFAISTYDTDYILVKSKDIEKAVSSLEKENYEIV